MLITGALRRALPMCALALTVTAAPALAFQPSVPVFEAYPSDHLVVTDIEGRGATVAVTTDAVIGGQRIAVLSSSTNRGASWENFPVVDVATRESQATVCAGYSVMVFTSADLDPATEWSAHTLAVPMGSGPLVEKGWHNGDVVRNPDIACVANDTVVIAWFQRTASGFDVKVKTGQHDNEDSGVRQSRSLGSGTRQRGLAIATSSTRVYVAWFDGDQLKLGRFSIGGGSHHDLTSLGTTTVATLPYGRDPEIGADGDRVILAYSDRADLKVRRSTNRGVSWGSAQTLRNEPFASEIGAFPTTVAVKGSKVAIGGLEIGGIDELIGEGLGYRSLNGGSSYTELSTHASGRIVAGLVKVAGIYKYAEAWDQTLSDPDPEVLRYRRK
jgi:hypothetical protein